MKTKEIILAGITGTTAFTLFSYMVSKSTGKNFKEPELIGKMIDHPAVKVEDQVAQFAGWITHYIIGISFAAAYKKIIDSTNMKPTLTNGMITGAFSGLPATLGWHTSLSIHPVPPRKKSFDYYAQLFFGHIIFGAASFFVFGAFKKRSEKKESKQVAPLEANEIKLSHYASAGS